MLPLQVVNGIEDLLYLIPRHTPMAVLDIDPWVSLPGRSVYMMRPMDAGWAEISIADPLHLVESTSVRIAPHRANDLLDARQVGIPSL